MPNQHEPFISRIASDAGVPLTSVTVETSKDLTLKAIDFLWTSYSSMHHICDPPHCPNSTCNSEFGIHWEEIVTLCESSRKSHALCLANMVSQIAIDKRTPTLLVTSNYSAAIFAVNLLLWRAGIPFDDALQPDWGLGEFNRIAVATGITSVAPLHFVGCLPFSDLQDTVRYAVANLGTRCLVLDDSTRLRLEQLLKLRGELPMAIQFLGENPSAILNNLN